MRFVTTLAAALLLTGCFSEDYSFCPPDQKQVVLHYRLTEPGTRQGEDVFAEYITTVTTAIYDAQGVMVQALVTSAADHALFQGVRLNLPPGTYRAVSWANAGVDTRINDLDTRYDQPTWIDYRSQRGDELVGACDPLYYAPDTAQGEYTFTVDAQTGHEGTLDFRHAHRRVEIYVRGLSAAPMIRLTGLPAGLEFVGMGTWGDQKVDSEVLSQGVRVEDEPYDLSVFTTFYFHLTDFPVGVQVLDAQTGEVRYTTTLAAHIDPATDDPRTQRTLRLIIDLSGGFDAAVGVSIPTWNSDEVTYEWYK